jgi:hypothetical protein
VALLSELPDERANEGAWSELEHRFFAAAPPDVPEPPPEPMRFDDLDPVEALPPSPWRARLSRTWRATAPVRRRLHATGRDAYRRAAPAVVRAWRRSIVLSVVARKWSATALRRSAPALAALRIGARNHRLIAAGAAALVVVMGISAVVVASRGGGRAEQASSVPPAAGGACAMVAQAAPQQAPAPILMSAAEPEIADSSDAIAPDAARPARHKRKHAKPPARHVVRVAVKPAKASPRR